MKRVMLIAFEDQSTGSLGLGVEGIDTGSEQTNSATEGLLIAHDLLEHVNGIKNIGSIPDELEALGGIWFVRGQHGELSRDGSGAYYTIHENVASDITRMFRDHFCGGERTIYAPKTRAGDMEEDFNDVIAAARKTMLSEIDESERDDARRQAPAFLAASRSLMRVGYRKARRRFAGDANLANTLFWRIAEAVTPYARHPEFEGQRFELVYGLRNGRPYAACSETYEEDY